MAPAETPVLTLAAAVAAVRAIYAVTGIRTGIKWPNDIICDGRKMAGILLEMNSEADRVNHIILGIGINYSQTPDDFPEEIRDRAISDFMRIGRRSVRGRPARRRENAPDEQKNEQDVRNNCTG